MFENLSANGKLLRILAALCRRSGGELRLPLEAVDTPGDPTQLDYFRDRGTQEFIIRTAKENEVLLESMRLTPEITKAATTPVDTPRPSAPEPPANGYTRSSAGLTDEQLVTLEKQLTKRRVAALIAEDLKRRKQQEGQ